MSKSFFFLLLIFTALISSSFGLKQVNRPVCADFFSPNGDGHNDFFIIENLSEFPINKLFIFNRWGETVYITEPYKNNWDGTMNVNQAFFGNQLPEAMYLYRFEYYVGDFLVVASGKIILKR